MEIDKSTQGTLEDQMFYRRITLKELTRIRNDNPTDEVMNQNSSKIRYCISLQYLRNVFDIFVRMAAYSLKSYIFFINFQDFVFTTIATIDRLQENIQWWYMSCDVCNKITTKESHNYYCKNCDVYPEGLTPR